MKTIAGILLAFVVASVALSTSPASASAPPPSASAGWTLEPVAFHGGSAPPDIGLDSRGVPHVLFCPPGESRYAVRGATGWINERFSTYGGGGVCGNLAMGPGDVPHATTPFTAAIGCAAYGVRRNGTWDLSCFPGGVMDAVDSLGRPHAVTYWTISPTRYDLRHLWREADGTWQFETAEAKALSAFPSFRWYSMALDAADNPRVLYYDSVRGDVRYAVRDAAGWHVEVVEPVGGLGIGGREGSLALDRLGSPHAAYTVRLSSTTTEVRYATRGAGGWSTEVVSPAPPPLGGGGYAPSVAVGPGGVAVLYRFDAETAASPLTFDTDLRFATRAADGWTAETAYDGHLNLNVLTDPWDDDVDSPQFPSMVLDGCGNPHVAFFRGVNLFGDISLQGAYYATKGYCDPTAATASLRVEPRTLNLRSRGQWVTATVTLDGATAADVDLASLAVNGVAPDKVLVLNAAAVQLKVSREEFKDTLPDPPKFGTAVTVTLTGQWKDGGAFTATDTIRILRPGR